MLYFQIQMINKKEVKEEKALSDRYQFCPRYRVCGLSTVLPKKKKIQIKHLLLAMIKIYSRSKFFTLKFFFKDLRNLK